MRKKRLKSFLKNRKKIYIPVLLLLLVLAVWFWSSGSSGKTEILSTVQVNRGSVVKSLDATGIIKPEVGAIVKIGSRATGIIRHMHVRVGDSVKKDQVIAEIDSRELEAIRKEAEAALKRAKSEYSRILSTFPLQIKEAEAKVASARAVAEYEELNYLRRKELVEQDLDARNTLDVAKQQSISAAQNLTAADATLRRLRQEFSRQKESTAQAVVQAEASLSTANIRLSYAEIRSPIDGIVSQVTAQEGETVVAGLQVANLITVLDPTRLEMWVFVDETDIGQVTPGLRVEFKVDSLPEKRFEGAVQRVYPEPEIRDSIVYYKTLVPLDKESALLLRPEMTTQCKIIVSTKDNVLRIPNEAIKWVNGKQTVFVKTVEGSARQVEVSFGMQGAEFSEVLDGLEEGDQVAVRLIIGSQSSSNKPASNTSPGPRTGGGTRR